VNGKIKALKGHKHFLKKRKGGVWEGATGFLSIPRLEHLSANEPFKLDTRSIETANLATTNSNNFENCVVDADDYVGDY